ncbi:MAG: hypothetical protein JWO30_3555 [Fibrobacteres bacterium]|nr:hypothetical protein [Fibrobacterota bacterium]
MKAQRGFTLIEAMVAGIISVIIPGVVITLLRVNNSQLSSNSTQMRLSQIADVVSEEIHQTAVSATYVYSTSEAGVGGCPVGDPIDQLNLDGVVFCNAAKAMIKGYRVVRLSVGNPIGRLQERLPGDPDWKPFIVGSDTVKVTINTNPYNLKSGGIFEITDKSQAVSFNLHYDMRVAGVRDSLPVQTESVVCRNAVSRPW